MTFGFGNSREVIENACCNSFQGASEGNGLNHRQVISQVGECQMKEENAVMETDEKRSESRTRKDQYYSVEFSIQGVEFSYQFKIWDVSAKGMCVLVKEDSDILSHLKVGDVINMKYYQDDSYRPVEYLKTEIRHITKDDTGRFPDNYLVGLAICA